jgi:lysyl-tRNA synthetase class 2
MTSVQRRARRLGVLVATVGVLDVVSAFTPGLRARVDMIGAVFTPGVPDVAAGATAVIGLGLILLGRGLGQRRRLAYVTAAASLAASALTHLLRGGLVLESILALGAVTILVRNRALFVVPPCRRRARTLVILGPAALALVVVYGASGLLLERARIHPALTPLRALREVAARLVGLPGPLHLPDTYVWLPVSLTVLGGGILLGIAVLALGPVRDSRARVGDRARVRALADRPDGDTLGPFSLRADKSYVFSPDGRAAVAYRYVHGVGLASGDPVGEPASFAAAVGAFLDHCDRHGWRPAFLGARDDLVAMYRAAGLRCHYLGDEAIIDVAEFTLDGRAMRPVRQACNRATNQGVSTEIRRERELPAVLLAELRQLAERSRQGAPERGFSMALDGLLTGRDGDCVVAIARDSDGAPLAVQRYVPCRAGRGLSLDAMRREQRGPNGLNERLIADVVLWARDQGIDEVSLNFAFFRSWLDDSVELSRFQTFETWLVRRLNPYFQIESLLTFNAKFLPRWVPRHLVYRSVGHLGSVALAAMSAEAFLPFDRQRDQAALPAAA